MSEGRAKLESVRPVLRERAEGAAAHDTAVMVYTSGTTGQRKGACLSHRYIIDSVESLRETIPIYDEELTPTLKVRREVVWKIFWDELQGLYGGAVKGAEH